MSTPANVRFGNMKAIHHSKDMSDKAEYSNPDHETRDPLPFDWKDSVSKPMREGDLEGMKQNGLVAAQLQMLHLAHSSDSDAVKFNATAFLLSQSGHGPMSRIEHTIDYKKMPADQLKSIITAKLASITRRNPQFDVKGLLSAAKSSAIEVDVPRETFEMVSENHEEEPNGED